MWTLYLRGADKSRLGEIHDYQKLEAILRFDKVGTWLLDLDYSTDAAQAFDFDKGLIAERDGEVIFSGPVLGLRREWAAGTDRLIVNGADDNAYLAWRLAYPEPSGDFTLAGHDVRSGVAETVMRAYVNANLGPGALVARQVAGLTLAADEARGLAVTGRARFPVLLDLLASLALAGGDLGFRMVQQGSGVEFQVYEPRDQSDFVIFSRELGNLSAFNHESEGPEANYLIGAGGGEGTARMFVEKGDAASVAEYGRIEQFRDRRDTTDAAEIEQTLDEELAAKGDRFGLSLSPAETLAFGFGSDYALGDRVSAVVDGVVHQDVIRELAISLTADGETITPTIGTPGTTNHEMPFVSALREQRSRISNLERI